MRQDLGSYMASGLPHQWSDPHPDDQQGEGAKGSSGRSGADGAVRPARGRARELVAPGGRVSIGATSISRPRAISLVASRSWSPHSPQCPMKGFGAIASSAMAEGDSDDSARRHVEDTSRDAARNDRTFARSTAKLTPALFAERTGGSGASARGKRTATQTSTVVVSEVENPEAEGWAAVAGMRAADQADQTDLQPPPKKNQWYSNLTAPPDQG